MCVGLFVHQWTEIIKLPVISFENMCVQTVVLGAAISLISQTIKCKQ